MSPPRLFFLYFFCPVAHHWKMRRCLLFFALAAVGAMAAQPNPPVWPSTVAVFGPGDTDIDAKVGSLSALPPFFPTPLVQPTLMAHPSFSFLKRLRSSVSLAGWLMVAGAGRVCRQRWARAAGPWPVQRLALRLSLQAGHLHQRCAHRLLYPKETKTGGKA